MNIQVDEKIRVQTSADPYPRFDTWKINTIEPVKTDDDLIEVTVEKIASQEGRPGATKVLEVSKDITLDELQLKIDE